LTLQKTGIAIVLYLISCVSPRGVSVVTSNFGEYARADVGKVHAALTAVLRAVRYQFWGRGVPCPVHSAQSIVGRQLRHLHPFSSHQDVLSSVTLVIVIMIVNLLLVVCSMQRAV
jgi:hypothetical protein